MVKLVYSSNNSGGSFWLKERDWKALEAAGWVLIERKSPLFLGQKYTEAYKMIEYDEILKTIAEFFDVTGQNIFDFGCSCCGAPHSFRAEDENEERIKYYSQQDASELLYETIRKRREY